MYLAVAKAIALLATQSVPPVVKLAAPEQDFVFGPDYIVPSPFDPRLLERICIAVAEVAEETGVAKNPIEDIAGYKAYLNKIQADEMENDMSFIAGQEDLTTGDRSTNRRED